MFQKLKLARFVLPAAMLLSLMGVSFVIDASASDRGAASAATTMEDVRSSPPATATATPTATATATATPTATATATPTATATATPTATTTANPARAYLPILSGMDGWSPVGDKPPGVSRFYDVAVCGEQKLAGTDKGLYIYNSGNGKWKPASGPIPADKIAPGIAFVPPKQQGGKCTQAYVASAGGIYYGNLESNEWTWTRVDENLVDAFSVLIVGDKLYVAGGFGVSTTTPLPTTSVATTWTAAKEITTLTLGLNRSEGGTTLAAVWGMGIFAEGSDGLGNPIWTSVGALPSGSAFVYEADRLASGVLIAGASTGLLRWDKVAGWSVVRPGQATFAVKAVGASLYAGQAMVGVLLSPDGGSTWVEVNEGLDDGVPGFQVRGFQIGTDGKLYAATTSGVYVWSGTP